MGEKFQEARAVKGPQLGINQPRESNQPLSKTPRLQEKAELTAVDGSRSEQYSTVVLLTYLPQQ